MTMSFSILHICAFAIIIVLTCSPTAEAAVNTQQQHSFGPLSLTFVTNDIVHVSYVPDGATPKTSLVVTKSFAPVDVKVTDKGTTVELLSAELNVVVDKNSLAVVFHDAQTNDVLLAEKARTVTPTIDMGKPSYAITQTWTTQMNESVYGLGQFQNAYVDYRSAPLRMLQYNIEDANPFFVSTGGYGVLWDMYSDTFLNKPTMTIDTSKGTFDVPSDGTYYFQLRFDILYPGCTGNHVVLQVDGHKIVNWTMNNMPNTLSGYATLKRGTVPVVLNVSGGPVPTLYYRVADLTTSMTSMVEPHGMDYYFARAKSIDHGIAQYRTLSGTASQMPLWTYGFMQSKEHYQYQKEVIGAVQGFRDRGLPLDTVVQDWHYWGDLGWGPQWDPKYYPDPKGMVDTLRGMNSHLMVSVWSRFDETTSFYKDMDSKGYIINASTYYDPTNPDARNLFYNFSKKAMFDIGVDSLWLDATEPEGLVNADQWMHAGTGNEYMNTYPLLTTAAISDGLRADYHNRRVFSLTRSTFLGQQRNGACLWSGDTESSWDTLERQVVASVNFQLSGQPCWSQDIGGFFRPSDQYTSEAYHDLLVRWFQFGAFTPVYRVHGSASNTEYWNYGPDVLSRVLEISNLRYRLLPYIYSMAVNLTLNHYTMQRALVFDYPADTTARTVGTQYMFGPSLMVAPLSSPTGSRDVYFPSDTFVDFYTGEVIVGPKVLSLPVPSNQIPLYGRAGGIVLMGPYLNYTTEHAQDVQEVRVYRGASGTFTQLEDDGESADSVSSGAFTSTTLHWDDNQCVFSVGARVGSYKGMVTSRTYKLVLVRPGAGVGVAPTSTVDATVQYTGSATSITVKC